VLSDENGLKLTIRPEGWSTLLRERKFPEVVQQCGLLDLLDERCREIAASSDGPAAAITAGIP
jgi:hypothetical protein